MGSLMEEIESVVTRECANCSNFLSCWIDARLMQGAVIDCEMWMPDWNTIENNYLPELRKKGIVL